MYSIISLFCISMLQFIYFENNLINRWWSCRISYSCKLYVKSDVSKFAFTSRLYSLVTRQKKWPNIPSWRSCVAARSTESFLSLSLQQRVERQGIYHSFVCQCHRVTNQATILASIISDYPPLNGRKKKASDLFSCSFGASEAMFSICTSIKLRA
jgi:hypothetical protein